MEQNQHHSGGGSLDDEIRRLQHANGNGHTPQHRLQKRRKKLIKFRSFHPIKRFKVLSRTKKAILVSLALLIAFQPVLFFWWNNEDSTEAAVGTATLRPDADQTRGWTVVTDGNAGDGETCDATNHFRCVNESSAEDSDHISTGTAGTTGETEEYTVQNPTIDGTFLATTKVDVKWRADTPACQSTCDIVAVNIYINGALRTAQNQTISATTTNYTTTFSGSWAAIDDLRIQFVRSRQGSGGPSSGHDDNVRLFQAYADVTYNYIKPLSKLTMKNYIWEMDDASGDSASQLAASNTGITMRRGERATLRAQIRNTGGPIDTENFGLFYDRNDGIWSKVKNFQKPITSAGNCDTDTKFSCTTIASATSATADSTSITIDKSGRPWISYYDGGSNDNLMVAKYVGSGGNGCTSSAWTCTTIEATNDIGGHTSMAFDIGGVPWVAYEDSTNDDIRIATFVGSGGNCDATGGSDAWQCTTIYSTNDASKPSLVTGPGGEMWLSFYESELGCGTTCNLRVAQYLKGATSGTGCAVNTWTCTTVYSTGSSGLYNSIAIASDSNPWISFSDGTNNRMIVAQYLSGSTSGSGCAINTWTCTVVVSTAASPKSAIDFDSSGNAWVAYQYGASDQDIRVAKYVGSSGSGCTSGAWTCTLVDEAGDVGFNPSIAFDTAGYPWISHYDSSNSALKISRYVGSNGNCDDAGGSDAWQCTTVETTGTTGLETYIAVDGNGMPWISYYSTTSTTIKVASIVDRAGEVLISPSYGGAASFTESHVDMTSTTDTSNRDDADCVDGGTWNNGKIFTAEEGEVSIADGRSTAQCTEVAFTIDTTQAVAGTTYRFVIATDDGFRQYKGQWRGPIGVDNYPTITIEDDSKLDTIQHISKSTAYTLPDCDDTSWGCEVIDPSAASINEVAQSMDENGDLHILYDGTRGLTHAKYVQSGGNCDSLYSGSDAWNCTVLTTALVSSIDIKIINNVPWIYYTEQGYNLKVAKYVGSGGNCDSIAAGGSDAWECYPFSSWIAYGGAIYEGYNNMPIVSMPLTDEVDFYPQILTYVGSGGNCDTIFSGPDAWQCTPYVPTPSVGSYLSSMIDNSGQWAFSFGGTGGVLNTVIAQYVGAGGDCDTLYSLLDSWECTDIDVTDSVGQQSSINTDNTGNYWVSYRDGTNSSLEVANYVGSGGNCDTVGAGSDAWNCTTIDANDSVGLHSSLHFNPNGAAEIVHLDDTNASLEFVSYVGSGGNCDSVGGGSDAWNCTTIDNTRTLPTIEKTSIDYDKNGNPWIAYIDDTNDDLRIAVKKNFKTSPTYLLQNISTANNGTANYGKYILANGKPSASSSSLQCTGAADLLGLCGIAQEDGQYDSMTAPAYHRPMYQMRARFNNNSVAPEITWAGMSSLAPSTAGTTGDLKLQIYRYGTTNAWEDVATNTTCAADTACVLSGTPTGTLSEYFEADGSNYWVYTRLIQNESTSTSATLKTDAFRALQPQQLMRHGRTFNRSLLTPFNTENR